MCCYASGDRPEDQNRVLCIVSVFDLIEGQRLDIGKPRSAQVIDDAPAEMLKAQDAMACHGITVPFRFQDVHNLAVLDSGADEMFVARRNEGRWSYR